MERLYLLFGFVLAFVIAFFTTPLVKTMATKAGIVDKPGEARRVHKKPIPLLGGLAIFYGFVVSVISLCEIEVEIRGMILGALIIVITGVIDDTWQMNAKIKLLFQILAAVVLVLHNVRIDVITVPGFISPEGVLQLGWWGIPITILWIVGVTNAVNLIDGLDGLAAGVCSIASMSLFCIALIVGEQEVAIITAALAGACFGFLPYNFNPAKIFMGDTGAMFLGFILATVSILGVFKSYAIISFAVPFLVLGLPLFDTGFAIIRRAATGKPIMSPDRGHIHHQVLDMGFSQKSTVMIMYLFCTVLGVVAVVLITSGALRALILMAVIIGGTVFASRKINMKNIKELVENTKNENEEQESSQRNGELND